MSDVNYLSHIAGSPDAGDPTGGGRAQPGDEWTPLRRASGPPRARSLLLTVLGEFVRPGGGGAWTSTLVEALGLLGVEEPAARQALARSNAADLLAAERVGRRTRWTLTERADRLLEEGTRRIYSFGLEQDAWDGHWLLVLTTVPEHNRHLRSRMRSRMSWLGFGSLGAGVWVTPWADREADAQAVLEEMGLAAGSMSWIGRPGAMGSLEARVSEIWDLDLVAGQYADFVAAAESEHPEGPAGEFAALARLVHDWRHFPATDPGLPAPLLPGSWPGPSAAATFHERHAKWGAGARRWWDDHAPPG